MKRKITISYEWKQVDGSEVNPDHAEQLHDSALDHIHHMVKDGFVQGQLVEEVLTREEEDAGQDPTNYKGWWSSITEE